jgi:phosphoserine phosphatase
MNININIAKESLKNADAICFDVDSTILCEEGINVLAESLGVGDAVTKLTSYTMEGTILFEDTLRDRLDLIKPRLEDIENIQKNKPLHFTNNLKELIKKIHKRGINIYLVSGGFRQMINPIALELGIPINNIYANNLYFSENGEYNGFDSNELTSKDGGKSKVLQHLIDKYNYNCVVMIGDGITDLQAKPPAKAFIGYGGIVERDKIKLESDWFIKDFKEILDVYNEDESALLFPTDVEPWDDDWPWGTPVKK